SSGGPYDTTLSCTSSPCPDTGLSAGTAYYYVATATDSGGTSAQSGQTAVTTVPPAPTIGVSSVSDTSVTLTLTAAGANAFTVKRGTGTGGPYGTTLSCTSSPCT